MIQVSVAHNGGNQEDIFFRYTDTNNTYTFVIVHAARAAAFMKLENGALTSVGNGYIFTDGTPPAVKANGTSLKAWFDGTLCASVTDSTFGAGGQHR